MASGADVGFSRAEMHSEVLAGTASAAAGRHIFLVWGKASEWPEKTPGQCPEGSLPRKLDDALKAAEKNLSTKVKWNLVEAANDDCEGDVLVFPDYLRFQLGCGDDPIKLSALINFLCKTGDKGTFDVEDLGGRFAFVCAHANRDARCGHCGPRLAEAMEAINSRDLNVRRCSHVGGHKYAGNVIVFSGASTKEDGHWYGYVKPENIDTVLSGKAAYGHLWRGQLGLSAGAQKDLYRRAQRWKHGKPLAAAGVVLIAVGVAYLMRCRSKPAR